MTMADTTKWNRKIDFLFACAGGAIGLGNVWRFPYICYAYGGGAFLIPYLTVAACVGIPVFFLESCLGQLTGGDMIKIWKIAPLFKGIGYANLVTNLFGLAYFNVILAWLARYLIASFKSVLPWNSCNNYWNTETCVLHSSYNVSFNTSTENNVTISASSPVEEFWEKKVLQLSNSIEEIGSLNLELTACLITLWVVVYFCIWRGVKWTSKVVYFTVPFPFLLLFVVLIRGVTLEGASLGIGFYLKPNITALGDPQVWVKAIEQVCYSFAIGWGFVSTLASHNVLHHNFYRDAVAIVCLNIFTSFLSGFVVFSVLGNLATMQNVTVASVVKSGPGLAFLAYPQALNFLPLPQLWSALFFLMMLFLSLDSLFVSVECVTLTMFNLLPKNIRSRKRSYEVFCAIIVCCFCLVSIPMVTEGGLYIFRIFEFGSTGWTLVLIIFSESVGVGWLIGADKFLHYASILLQKTPFLQIYLKICWKYIIPFATPVLAILAMKNSSSIYYADGTPFPTWALALGWLIVLSSILLIPFAMFHLYLKKEGTFIEKLRRLIKIDESVCLFNQKEASLWSIKNRDDDEKSVCIELSKNEK